MSTREQVRLFWDWIEEVAEDRGLSLSMIEDACGWLPKRLTRSRDKGSAPNWETFIGLQNLLRLDREEALSRLPPAVRRRIASYQREIDVCLTCYLDQCQPESELCPLNIYREEQGPK